MIPGLCDVLKLEAICSLETSIDSHGITRHFILEDEIFLLSA
jgi:hypothetical protein